MAKNRVARRIFMGVSGGAVGAAAFYAARRFLRSAVREIQITRSILIMRPPLEVHRAWRDVEHLPRILRHLEQVNEVGGGRAQSHWRAHFLAGAAVVEWNAELVDEREGKRLVWRSVPGTGLDAMLMLRFEPAQDGDATLLHLELSYRAVPPVTLDRAMGAEVAEDLRRFKAHLEAGEAPTIVGQPAGAGRKDGTTLIDVIGGAP